MRKKKTIGFYIVSLFALCLILVSCYKDDEAPAGPVNFSIDMANAENNHLATVGGYEYYTGGYNGVIVFRYSLDEFRAYERACPKDHDSKVWVEESGITMKCEKCQSQFVYTDGSPISGPAGVALRSYDAIYDGRYVWIRN